MQACVYKEIYERIDNSGQEIIKRRLRFHRKQENGPLKTKKSITEA